MKINPKVIIISGGDSWVNRGDKAILTGTLKILEEIPNIKVCILSGNPTITKQDYPKYEVINRNNFFDLITSIKRSYLFLWGGGHLLQNTSSKLFLIHQFLLLLIPIVFKKKIMGFSLGVEEINGNFWKLIAQRILNRFTLISVRDNLSREILINLGIHIPIFITSDPAVILKKTNDFKSNSEQSFVIIAPRKWFHYKSRFFPIKWQITNKEDGPLWYLHTFAKIADYIIENYSLEVYFLPMYPGNNQGDEIISQEIINLMENKQRASIIDSNINTNQLIQFVSNSSLLIGMRMHATILSICGNVPAISIYYQNKGKSFFEAMELEDFAIPIEQINEPRVFNMIDYILENELKIKIKIELNRKKLSYEVTKNLKFILDILDE